MPTPLPGFSFIEVHVVGTHFDQMTISTFKYRYTDEEETPDYLDVINPLQNDFMLVGGPYDKLLACLSENWTCTFVGFQPVFPQRIASAKLVPLVVAGNQPAPDLPTNCAAYVERRGDLATRGNVGGLHLPAQVINSLDSDTNKWTDPHVARLAELAVQMKRTLNTGFPGFNACVPVIYGDPNGTSFAEVTQATPSNEPRTMRRRNFRIGI